MGSAAGGLDPWMERPSLEYQHAFDCCAVELQRVAGPVTVVASHPFYARELLKRLDGCHVSLVLAPDWNLPAEEISRWLGYDVARSSIESDPGVGAQAQAAVWAEPQREVGEEILERIGRTVRPGGQLYVVASGWLRRFLPEWQRGAVLAGQEPAGLRAATRWLRAAGWHVERPYGFHGPRSVCWGLAAHGAARLARLDCADLCHFGMRAAYVVHGWQASLAPVTVVTARKG